MPSADLQERIASPPTNILGAVHTLPPELQQDSAPRVAPLVLSGASQQEGGATWTPRVPPSPGVSRLVSPSLGPPIAEVTSVSPPSRSSPRQPHLSVHGTLADVPGRHLEHLSPARISMPLMSSPANPTGGWCVGSVDSSGALAMEGMPTGH
ncbi:MAG: hypothetical protein ACPIOQ_38360, partial [Promethearchaeia archaeon]